MTRKPEAIWSLGLSMGMTVDKFLEPIGGSQLSPKTKTHSTQSLALLRIQHTRGLTLEIPFMVQRKFKLATTDKARWCIPAGAVIAQSGAMSNGEICDEQPIGPLNRRYSVQVGAFVGRFSPSSFWRLAVGPVVSLSTRAAGDTNNSYKVGGVLPLYIGAGLLKKDLNGLVRVALSAMYEKAGDGTTDKTIAVSLAILSSSTLFPSVFDQF